jgi:hypothetical protein
MRAGSSSRSSFTGLVRRQAVRGRFEAALTASGALASMVFILLPLPSFQRGPTCPLSRGSATSTGKEPSQI